jgi:hypothetical protein
VNRILATIATSVVLTSAAVACGDLLGLGSPRDGWPAEGGAWMSSGPTDAAGAAVDASTPPTPNDVDVVDAGDAGLLSEAPEASDLQGMADITFPAVGFVTGVSTPVNVTSASVTDHSNERLAALTLSCTGVLVGPRTVLTSVNCLASATSQTRFALNPTGDALLHADRTIVYAVQSVHRSPGGQAALLLAVASDQPEPSSIGAPMLTMTSTDGIASPFGWHSGIPAAQVLRSGTGTMMTASWRIENPTSVVRRAQGGGATLVDDSSLQLDVVGSLAPVSSDLGAPAFAHSGALVMGSLYQPASSLLSFHTTFSAAEGSWLEQMLWLRDESMIQGVAPPSTSGPYSWSRESELLEDPPEERDPLPATFFEAGSEVVTDTAGNMRTRSFGICLVWMAGQQIPGKFWAEGGCSYDANGGEAWPLVYKLLQVSGSSSWQSASAGVPVPGSFAPGYAGPTPLVACRASYGAGVDPGVVRQGACDVTWGGVEQVVPQFETLVIGPL